MRMPDPLKIQQSHKYFSGAVQTEVSSSVDARDLSLHFKVRFLIMSVVSVNLKPARPWAIKTHAVHLWGDKVRGWARKAWMTCGMPRAIRSRIEPAKKMARMSSVIWRAS